MKRKKVVLIVGIFLLGLLMAQQNAAIASGYSSGMKKGSSGIDDGRHSKMEATKALSGYCPVCLIEGNKVVKGKSYYSAEYEGKTYYFIGSEQKEMFLENPEKYTDNIEEKLKKAKNKSMTQGSGYQKKGS